MNCDVDEGNLMDQAHDERRARREDEAFRMMASRQPQTWLPGLAEGATWERLNEYERAYATGLVQDFLTRHGLRTLRDAIAEEALDVMTEDELRAFALLCTYMAKCAV